MRLLLKDQLYVWLQKSTGAESLAVRYGTEKCASGVYSQAAARQRIVILRCIRLLCVPGIMRVRNRSRQFSQISYHFYLAVKLQVSGPIMSLIAH